MFAMVLAIGLLVDDAIVVIENVERVMAEEGLSPREATRKSMSQITGALCGIALVLAALQRRGVFRGQLIKLYILAYLAYRFATEFLRPEPVLALGLTGYQWACLGLAPVFLGLWAKDASDFRRLEAGPAG